MTLHSCRDGAPAAGARLRRAPADRAAMEGGGRYVPRFQANVGRLGVKQATPTQGSYQPWFLESPCLEPPECMILMFIRSLVLLQGGAPRHSKDTAWPGPSCVYSSVSGLS